MDERAPSPDCIVAVSREIAEDAEPVRIMIRQLPEELELGPFAYGLEAGAISGWVLLTGEEEGEDLVDGGSSIRGVPLGALLERDPSLAPWLLREAPCVLERAEEGDPFEVLEDPEG